MLVYAVLDALHDYRTEKIFTTKELAEYYIRLCHHSNYDNFEIAEFEVMTSC